MDKLWHLSQINLFEALPEEDLMVIDKMAPMAQTKKGTVISSPERCEQCLYLLKKGRVRLFKLSPEGREFTMAILGDGNIFGEIETFSTGTKNVYVEAMEDTVLCVLRKEDFEEFLKSKPQLAYKLIQLLTQRLRDAQEMLENLAFGDVKTRLVYLFLKLSESFGVEGEEGWLQLDLPLTQQELANMIGSTRETVSSILNQLVQEQIIRFNRKTYWVNPRTSEAFILGE